MKFQFDPTEEEMEAVVKEEQGFVIRGLTIESAEFDPSDKRIKMAAKLSSPLPTMMLRWVRRTGDQDENTVDLPLYLNRSRRHLLCSVQVSTFGVPAHSWYQRGVALFAGTE